MILKVSYHELIHNHYLRHPEEGNYIAVNNKLYRLFDYCWDYCAYYAHSLDRKGYLQAYIHLTKKAFSYVRGRFYWWLNMMGFMETPEGCYARLADLTIIRRIRKTEEVEKLSDKVQELSRQLRAERNENIRIKQDIQNFLDKCLGERLEHD